jgi:hypothetical protein
MSTIKKSATRLARQEKRAARRGPDKYVDVSMKPLAIKSAIVSASVPKTASVSDYRDRQGTKHEDYTPPKKAEGLKPMTTPKVSAPTEESFGQVFARERKAGARTFTHNGKSYTTETKEDVAKKAAPVKKAETPAAKPAAKTYNLKQVVADQTGKRPVGSFPSPKTSTPAAKPSPTPPANRRVLPPAKCGTKVKSRKK